MAKRAYPRRYAQAAFELALEAGAPDKWYADLRRVADLCQDIALMALLHNPKITFQQKAEILAEASKDVSPLILNLAYLLVARGKLSIIGNVVAEYEHLWDHYRGIEHAEVITAVPLEQAELQRLAERLTEIVGQRVVVTPTVDPRIIGGIIARIDGVLLDGSTRSQLDSLHKELAASATGRKG
ncbi:MAG: ATP synthase F1 subunit delta [Chloroflexi bacterium]|nr:ATP synthase F1 subunit delta [Chloroflexota bacterium]